MKYTQLFVSVIFLVISLFLGYKVLKHRSKNSLNIKIAIIDSDKVASESLALKNIQKQIKEQGSELQREFESELEKFKPSKEEFELLSEGAKSERTEQFEKRALSVRDSYAKKMLFLEKSYRDAVDNIFNLIKKITKEIACKNNIELVLFISKKNQVLYSVDKSTLDKVDLSDKVLKNINTDKTSFENITDKTSFENIN